MNAHAQHDIARWQAAEEGQFFERKSALDLSGGARKPRKAAAIAHDIAEALAAFANADGGQLVVGIEDDGTVSGVPHADAKVQLLLGVPRIFDEMERAGCYPPRFDAIGGAVVQLTLRNEPIYDRATLEWLRQFAGVELSGDQKRVLAFAHAHGDRFTSRDYQKVIETDLYTASNAIKDMIRKGAVRSVEKGGRVYEVHAILRTPTDMPDGLKRLMRTLQGKGRVSNDDLRHHLGLSRYAAWRNLKDWTASGWITSAGASTGRGRYHVPGPRLLLQAETIQNVDEAATMASEAATMSSGDRLHHASSAPENDKAGAMPRETGAMNPKD